MNCQPDLDTRSAGADGPNTNRPPVENDAAMLRQMLTAYARRVGAGDLEDLATMATIVCHLSDLTYQAVAELRARGYSWAELGGALKITRQAAQQRWER